MNGNFIKGVFPGCLDWSPALLHSGMVEFSLTDRSYFLSTTETACRACYTLYDFASSLGLGKTF